MAVNATANLMRTQLMAKSLLLPFPKANRGGGTLNHFRFTLQTDQENNDSSKKTTPSLPVTGLTSNSCDDISPEKAELLKTVMMIPRLGSAPLRLEFSKRFYDASRSDWAHLPGHENIILLTDKNIASFIKNSDSLLLMFYTPWCYHCKNTKPEFAKAALKLATDLPHATLAAIDCSIYPSAKQQHGIEGYPTIKYFKAGKLMGEYEHRRNAADFVQFMKEKFGSPSVSPTPWWFY